VSRSEDKRTLDQKKKVGENQQLLDEVNVLRVNNRHLKGRVHSLESQLELLEARNKPRKTLTGGAASTVRSKPPGSASRTRTDSASAADTLPAVGDGFGGGRRVSSSGGGGGGLRATASAGQLMKGSALSNSRERAKMAEMMAQLDDNNREIGAQRTEIRRLREQVQMLVTQPGAAADAADGVMGSGVEGARVGSAGGGMLRHHQ